MGSRRNLLHRFFLHAVLALTATVLLWGGLMYYYQLSQLPNRIEQRLGISTETLASHLGGAMEAKDFTQRARELTERYPIVGLELYEGEGTLRFAYYRPGNEQELSELHRIWHRVASRSPRENHYFATRNGGHHYLHFSMALPEDEGYAEAIMTVPQRQVDSVRRSAVAVLLITVGTILVTVIVLFPLIYFAYRTLKRQKNELLISHLQMINALGNAIAKRDNDTDSHNHRVVYYAIRLAEALGLGDNAIRSIIKGAFLHDIGKIGIRDDILLSKAHMDKAMFKTMQRHPLIGEEIVANVSWLEDARAIIRYHHERFDGKGYPDGLSGEEIPFSARLFTLVDVFDALTSERPYKEAFSLEKALQIIADDSGSRFDPQITERFLEIAPSIYDAIAGKSVSELFALLIEDVKHYFALPPDINDVGIHENGTSEPQQGDEK